MKQAVRYAKLLTLTGKDKPDHSYQAAIYLLSSDAILCEKALPYVSTDGIDFPAMREKAPLDDKEQQIVSITHSLFTWKPVCHLSPYDLSQLGYPYIDYVSHALYITSGLYKVELRDNGIGEPTFVIDTTKYGWVKDFADVYYDSFLSDNEREGEEL